MRATPSAKTLRVYYFRFRRCSRRTCIIITSYCSYSRSNQYTGHTARDNTHTRVYFNGLAINGTFANGSLATTRARDKSFDVYRPRRLPRSPRRCAIGSPGTVRHSDRVVRTIPGPIPRRQHGSIARRKVGTFQPNEHSTSHRTGCPVSVCSRRTNGTAAKRTWSDPVPGRVGKPKIIGNPFLYDPTCTAGRPPFLVSNFFSRKLDNATD